MDKKKDSNKKEAAISGVFMDKVIEQIPTVFLFGIFFYGLKRFFLKDVEVQKKDAEISYQKKEQGIQDEIKNLTDDQLDDGIHKLLSKHESDKD